jgi:cytochrome bd ubiquinol oxidase subunit II
VVMPAMYLPIMLMLAALILRGVAFEFRLRGRRRGKAFWTAAFAAGSLGATVAQGLVLGGFIQGIRVEGGAFAGGPLDWLTPYTLLVAAGLVAGYVLLGASWMTIKAEGELHARARRWALGAVVATAGALAAVSLATLFIHPQVAERWGIDASGVDWGRLGRLSAIPLLGAFGLALAAASATKDWRRLAYFGAVLVFLSGYLGLAVGFIPYVAPYALTFRQAAAADNALALMLGGAAVLLPLILGYTAWVYWLFRGRVSADAGYH